MPRAAAMRKALQSVASATGAAAESMLVASEPAMAQLFSARMMSTATRAGAVALHSGLKPCHCGKVMCPGHMDRGFSTSALAAAEAAVDIKAPSLVDRHNLIAKYFPTSLSADDFIARVELALAGYGFTGDNSIAMSNLCRDESCLVLEDKIESVFGSCFSTHGLGGILTCGVIGMKAGLSHSPVVGGKERYVFFSFPHIAIDSAGKIGAVSRPNRPGASAACGALIAAMGDLKRDGLAANTRQPGEHDPLEPEYSILKQRIARRLAHEGVDPSTLDLVETTKAAERTITSDLEYLISKAVDPKKADYAVFTGVQIHNWAADLNDSSTSSMEFVSVGKSYVVVNGEKHYLDLGKVPALSPRQLQILSKAGLEDSGNAAAAASSVATLTEIPREYLMKRLGGALSRSHNESSAPAWTAYVKTTHSDPFPDAPKMDHPYEASQAPKEDAAKTSFFWKKP